MTPAALAKVRQFAAAKTAAQVSKDIAHEKHHAEDMVFKSREKHKGGFPHHKKADALRDTLLSRQNELLRAKVLKSVGMLGLAGLGVGVGGRALLALGGGNPQPRPLPAPISIPIPHPAAAEGKEKAAGLGSFLGSFLSGEHATTEPGIPWAWPAATLAAGGGLLAGWHGLDSILASRRKAGLEGEVEKAKKDYETALLGQYGKPKMAEEETPEEQEDAADEAEGEELLGEDLDKLASLIEKRSFTAADVAGAITGGYGTYSLLTGLPAAYLGYHWAKRRQNAAVLAKAQRERTRQLYAQQPAPLHATLAGASE